MTISANYPSIRPSLLLDFANTKQLDPRITYSRASTGTYYGGKTTAVAEQNLFPYGSNITATNWSFVNNAAFASTSATTAPDGTTTAFKVTSRTTGTGIAVADWSIGGVFPRTYSIYAKAAEYNYLVLGGTDSVNGNCVFDVSGGTVFSTGTNYTASITSVGNGWYRCVCTATAGAGLNYFAVGTSSDGSISNAMTTGSGVYIWGAQLEQRSSVTAYTPTTTAPITNYIPALQTAAAGVPRFDHDPITGESKGFLIEEQRTNLLTYSQEFDNAVWTKQRSTVTANAAIAPDGTLTADKIIEDLTSGEHRVYSPQVGAGTSAMTWSVRAKAGERSWIALRGDTGTRVANFNLTTGVVGTVLGTGVTSSMTPLGNGWYLCSMQATTSNANERYVINIGNADTGTGPAGFSYTGDGYSGIYIWGAQLEAGSFATSYIPTVASQVTRSADAQSSSGLGQIGQGTLYIEATAKSGNTLLTSGATTFTATAATAQKTAVAYNATNTRKSINGAAVTSSAGTQGGTNLSIMPGSTGTVKRIAVYPIKITDTELQAITS